MSQTLSSSRLEAFSDGVIAVIITIMVLDLKVPAREMGNMEGLRQALPLVLVYLLSFVQVGIYWVNHHYLLDDVEQVSHGMLWSNLAFLFCLSLFPFVTRWVAERGITSFSIGLYAAISVFPATNWMLLAGVIRRRTGKPLIGSSAKQIASTVLYLGAVPAAFLSPLLALAMIGIVAILWIIPPLEVVEATRRSIPGRSNIDSR